MYKQMPLLIALLATLMMTACTSIPTQLQGEYADVSPARVEPATFGTPVRWGGIIIDAKNETNRTCFEVLSRELDRYMRPKVEDITAGRFIACKNGFFDPEVFAKGREVTLVANITGIEEHKIDEFNYRYPLLEVNDLVLWEERQDVLIYRDFYDPYWYPYAWGSPYFGYYPYYRGVGGMGYGRSGYAVTRQTLPGPARLEPKEK
ncbi:MAG: Slp family lipoprotein [Xanthomonadales bacterium]|nr:Slp family lipoprotein [Xanthomonadales bacterium]